MMIQAKQVEDSYRNSFKIISPMINKLVKPMLKLIQIWKNYKKNYQKRGFKWILVSMLKLQ